MTPSYDDPISLQVTAQRLSAYLPATLTRQILVDGVPQPGVPRPFLAATLFTDLSGFTAMSEELSTDGPRGAEELNRVLLVTFTGLIDVIREMGGAVAHFHGDAMSVYFPDTDGAAAQRALAGAQMMQRLMLTSFNRAVTNRPAGKNPVFDLTIKIGVGYGRCQELVLGDSARMMEFVLLGTAVDEAAAAERVATSGQVVASRAVLQQVGMAGERPFAVVTDPLPQPTTQPEMDWSEYSDAALTRLTEAAAAFMPAALYRRLTATGAVGVAEHRPATSLFLQFSLHEQADADDGEMSQALGRQWQAYYQWASRLVARFGMENARVNRVLTGDKGNQLHIIFGAPVAPDAPEQALRCALALQRERPDFVHTQRVGLAVGKVFAGPVGSEQRREYTVVGDVVNLSARLMQVCLPDEVWTDRTTADRTRQWIEFDELLPVEVKGRQTVVMPYRAVGDRLTTSHLQSYLDRWQRPLFGRDRELELIQQRLDAALAGEGSVAALFGPTGSGKSRLLAHVVRRWIDAGGMGLLGVCQQHTMDNPFAPWRSIWRDFFGLTVGMTIDDQVHAVVTQVEALVPESAGDVGLWRDPLGLPIPQPEALQNLTAEARQVRFFTLVRRCFQAAARRQPLLIILEGLHWADQTSLVLLDDLTAHLAEMALFVAITFRPQTELELATLERPFCLPVPISDLSPQHARQLLNHLVGTETLPAEVEIHLGLRDREGRDSPVNPLFLEEALNVMMSAGVLRRNGRWQVDEGQLAQMQVPDTIHGLLLARLDRLPPSIRDLLQVASVIGRQFELESLNAVTDRMSRGVMLEMLAALTEADMTRLVTADPEWIYLFQHAMTHEVAYESLPYARRQSLHASVATWLEQKYAENLRPYHPVLAFHFSRANVHESALRYALLAAQDARAIFANREAVDLYNLAETHLQALGMAERWETAVDLFLARGEAQRFIGNFNRATQDVEQAISLAEDRHDVGKLAKSLNLMAELQCRQNHFEEGITFSKRVIDSFGAEISQDELSRSHQWMGIAFSSLGEYEAGLQHLHRAEQLCIATQNKERLARVLEAIAFVHYSQKKLELALPAIQRSIQLSRDFSVPVNVASALSNVSLIQFQLGRAEAALASINEAIAFVEDYSRNFLAGFIGNRAEILSYLGRYEEAIDDFEEAYALFTAMDDEPGLLEVCLVWAYEWCCMLHRWDEAARLYAQAGELIRDKVENYPAEFARLQIGQGVVAFYNGELEAAARFLHEAHELVEEKEISWWRPAVLYYLGLCADGMNEQQEAVTHWTSAEEAIVKGEGCPDYLPLVLFHLADAEPVRERKITRLQASVKGLEAQARTLDRVVYLRKIGNLLGDVDGEDVQALRHYCYREAERLSQLLSDGDGGEIKIPGVLPGT